MLALYRQAWEEKDAAQLTELVEWAPALLDVDKLVSTDESSGRQVQALY